MPKTKYHPIACSLYDEFELACLHKDRLMININNDTSIIATAINVYLEKETGEWFEVELDDGQKTKQRIRLDHIASFQKI